VYAVCNYVFMAAKRITELQCVLCSGAVPLATLKLVDETADETEAWRHLLIHEVRTEGAHNCTCFIVVRTL